MKEVEQPLYIAKTNLYKTKYDHLVNTETTDTRISDL